MKVEPASDIIVNPDTVGDSPVNPRTLDLAFRQWVSQLPRFEKLHDYYIGNQDFKNIHSGEDQNKIVANYCQYIVSVLTGYQFGNEPRYNADEDDLAAQSIIDIYSTQDKWNTEIQIGEDMSIYGKTFELVFTPMDKDIPNSTEINPLNAFVAYAGDLERDSVFGCVVYSFQDNNGKDVNRLYVYDQSMFSIWESDAKTAGPSSWRMIEGFTPHGFGRVPIIEYKNNRLALSDFEGIMDLQDAYNSLLSDRQDNQDSFAQAMLVLSGGQIIGTSTEEINEGKKKLKDHKVLQLDEDVVAQYLVKTTDETGVQIVQDQYASDIHKFAMVPDLSDEQFAGNSSGIAMAYKLFGTDQIVARKQSQMQKGFTRRCKLYDYRMNNPTMRDGYVPLANIDGMTITFNLNAPQDLTYVAQAVTQLTESKVLSLQTARRLVSAIPDPVEETRLVDEETKQAAELARQTYDFDQIEADRLREDADADTEESS